MKQTLDVLKLKGLLEILSKGETAKVKGGKIQVQTEPPPGDADGITG
jgi:hypothetical protein